MAFGGLCSLVLLSPVLPSSAALELEEGSARQRGGARGSARRLREDAQGRAQSLVNLCSSLSQLALLGSFPAGDSECSSLSAVSPSESVAVISR